ncbi:MAG: 30S ribosomal protein S20 [Ruminococcaceae bacterium]|nr:30S ribosomal protein S20 [Oscillospiraceae bacterium]
MPNIKSAIKRVKVSKIKTLENQIVKSTLKTYIKKFDAAVNDGDKTAAASAYIEAIKKIDKAVTKGVLHKNNAAHKKSALTLKLNSMEA